MGGTAETGIVSSEGHFDHVQHAFGHDGALLDQTAGRFINGHAHGRVIIGGAHDEIHLGHHAALIGPVMMRQGAARRLDTAHAFGRLLGGNDMEIRRSDLGIGGQFHPALRRIQ